MKKSLLATLSLIACIASQAQTSQTLIIQPSGGQGYESVISSLNPTQPNAAPLSIVAAEWTGNGATGPWRSFFKMSLTGLPSDAVIDSAFLSLYADVTSTGGMYGMPTYGTDNAATINRVTGPWVNTTLTWVNQPAFVTSNNAVLAQTTSTSEDRINIDVTNMVKDQQQYGNYGFVIKMVQENTTYNSQIFCSSATTADARQPSLKIKYHVPASQSVAAANPWGEQLNVFPNPADADLSIRIQGRTGAVSASLLDATGKLILQQSGQAAQLVLPTAHLPKGNYFIRISSEGKTGTVPVTLQ